MSEHSEQVALFKWAGFNRRNLPEVALMFAVPNGGARHPATAARLKAEGVRAGVPDIFLPASRGCWNGLFIELKRPRTVTERKGRVSAAQQEWAARLLTAGYRVAVCYGWGEAVSVIAEYLDEKRSD